MKDEMGFLRIDQERMNDRAGTAKQRLKKSTPAQLVGLGGNDPDLTWVYGSRST